MDHYLFVRAEKYWMTTAQTYKAIFVIWTAAAWHVGLGNLWYFICKQSYCVKLWKCTSGMEIKLHTFLNLAQEDTCLVCFYHTLWQFLQTTISGNWFYLILSSSGLCHCVDYYPEDEGRIYLQNIGISLYFYHEDVVVGSSKLLYPPTWCLIPENNKNLHHCKKLRSHMVISFRRWQDKIRHPTTLGPLAQLGPMFETISANGPKCSGFSYWWWKQKHFLKCGCKKLGQWIVYKITVRKTEFIWFRKQISDMLLQTQ
jgi:hypothetical protein